MKIHWLSKTTYVDINTGEQLTKQDIAQKNYRVLKTSKKIIIEHETKRIISYTNECSRNAYKQQALIP
jgi:hypothetical protein